jgi:hypothetical protein
VPVAVARGDLPVLVLDDVLHSPVHRVLATGGLGLRFGGSSDLSMGDA